MNKINGDFFINMLISASNKLENEKEEINKSNVFPVPDGDTGTNMSLTFSKAAKDVCTMYSSPIGDVAAALSSASLRGARGNSGVILSQFFRGISKELKGLFDSDIVTMAKALDKGTESAYRAVMKPTEGTILTVMKGISQKALEIAEEKGDFIEFFKEIIENGNAVLESTPELLPKLKQAGVVDSGGMGLMAIFSGMLYYMEKGEVVPINEGNTDDSECDNSNAITFTYHTEYVIKKEHRGTDLLKDKLKKIGDKITVIEDEETVFVSVDTDCPDMVLGFGLKIGALTGIKIENLKCRNIEIAQAKKEQAKKEKTKYGFVSVSAGNGFSEVFSELGITGIISGGQSMNPSTDDILSKAIEVNAQTVFVFPNNKNIILAANQAKELFDGNLIIIPTTSMAQVFPIMMAYDEAMSPEEIESAFNEALENVKVGEVTYAVRDSVVNDIEIKCKDIMEMAQGKVVGVSKNVETAITNVIDKLVDDASEVITLYAGSDIKDKELNNLVSKIEEKYPDCDVSGLRGDQPIYYYIVSVE